MLFGCFFNSHFVFVSGKHISFLNACAFGFAVIICPRENIVCLPKLKTPFFPKELEVAKYFAQGYVAREIAEILGKSKNTVSAQLRKMTKRLGLQSTRDIIKVVHQLNL